MTERTETCTKKELKNDNEIIVVDSINESEIEQQHSKERPHKKEVLKLQPKKGSRLTESAKKDLKKINGCRNDRDFHQRYIFPVESKTSVEEILKEHKIKADLISVVDFHPDKDEKTTSLENQILFLEGKIKESEDKLLIATHAYHRFPSDFREPPKIENFPENESEERKNSRYTIEMDFHKKYREIEEDKEKLEALRKNLSDHEKERGQDKSLQITATERPQLIDFNYILRSCSRNELGDAELFLTLSKDKYIFDCSEGKSGDFYYWTETHWKLDKEKQRYQDFEIVPEYYEKASIEALKDKEKNNTKDSLEKSLAKRAFDLRSARRRKSVFEFVSPKISFNEEWDYCPGKLPCANGMVDLKTGSLTVHKREDYIRSICPTKYNPQAARTLFNKFLDDITLGDAELKGFLGRVLGYALLGNGREEKIFIFYGKGGRNGKGTLMQSLERVLGGIAKTFPSEMLLLQRNPPSSTTPRPEKANLQGVRYAIFSEINENRKIDSSEVKDLSGGDTIVCRRLFSNVDVQIRPSHTMFIQTNYKPKASSKDEALWKRNVLFPFNADFVKNPKKPHERKLDEGFKEKLLDESEGILAWLVEGCLEYQRIGLAIPEIVRQETENYRSENDGIERFLKEACIFDPVFSTPKGKMEKAIKEFCLENKCELPTRNDISNYLKEKFSERRTGKVNLWAGVKIEDDGEFQA